MTPPLGPAVGLARRGAAWARRHTFSLPPHAWYAALGISVMCSCSLLATGVGPWWMPGIPLLIAAAVSTPSVVWWRLRRPDRRGRLVVALARFKQQAGAGPELGAVHANVLEREIRSRPALMSGVRLRPLKHELSEAQARRLLRRSAVRAVISGETIAAWDKARWEAWMMMRWHQMDGWMSRDLVSQPFATRLRNRKTRGDRMLLGADADQLISTLTAADFPANHVQAIVATLLAVVPRTEAQEQARSLSEYLPAEVRAVLENGHTLRCLEDGGDLMDAARRLEYAGDHGANHVWLWNQCLTYLTRAEQLDPSIGLEERRRVAGKALAVAPEDPVANIHMGIALLGLGEARLALGHLTEAAERARREVRPFVFELMHEGYRKVGDDDGARAALAHAAGRTPHGRWMLRRRFRRWDSEDLTEGEVE